MSTVPDDKTPALDTPSLTVEAPTTQSASMPSSDADAGSDPTIETVVEPAPAPAPAVALAGRYRITHGTFTVGPQQWATVGELVELTADEAKAALANKTVEAV